MVRVWFRRALRIAIGVVFLTTPAAVASDHGTRHGCEHQQPQQTSGDHHQSAPDDCEHSDACRECATPSCHATGHCGASSTGVPIEDASASLASERGFAPTAAAAHLTSITTGPPTPPPLSRR
ncbi:MAG: hypothetical protein ACKVZ0_00170 [Gemmatimonadales bacterium]